MMHFTNFFIGHTEAERRMLHFAANPEANKPASEIAVPKKAPTLEEYIQRLGDTGKSEITLLIEKYLQDDGKMIPKEIADINASMKRIISDANEAIDISRKVFYEQLNSEIASKLPQEQETWLNFMIRVGILTQTKLIQISRGVGSNTTDSTPASSNVDMGSGGYNRARPKSPEVQYSQSTLTLEDVSNMDPAALEAALWDCSHRMEDLQKDLTHSNQQRLMYKPKNRRKYGGDYDQKEAEAYNRSLADVARIGPELSAVSREYNMLNTRWKNENQTESILDPTQKRGQSFAEHRAKNDPEFGEKYYAKIARDQARGEAMDREYRDGPTPDTSPANLAWARAMRQRGGEASNALHSRRAETLAMASEFGIDLHNRPPSESDQMFYNHLGKFIRRGDVQNISLDGRRAVVGEYNLPRWRRDSTTGQMVNKSDDFNDLVGNGGGYYSVPHQSNGMGGAGFGPNGGSRRPRNAYERHVQQDFDASTNPEEQKKLSDFWAEKDERAIFDSPKYDVLKNSENPEVRAVYQEVMDRIHENFQKDRLFGGEDRANILATGRTRLDSLRRNARMLKNNAEITGDTLYSRSYKAMRFQGDSPVIITVQENGKDKKIVIRDPRSWGIGMYGSPDSPELASKYGIYVTKEMYQVGGEGAKIKGIKIEFKRAGRFHIAASTGAGMGGADKETIVIHGKGKVEINPGSEKEVKELTPERDKNFDEWMIDQKILMNTSIQTEPISSVEVGLLQKHGIQLDTKTNSLSIDGNLWLLSKMKTGGPGLGEPAYRYIFKKSADASINFTVEGMDDLNPRYVLLKAQVAENENKNEQDIKDLEIQNNTSYLELFDGSDRLTKYVHNNSWGLEHILKQRDATIRTSNYIDGSKTDPQKALEKHITTQLEVGVTNFYISINAHGATEGMGFGSNRLYSQDLIAIFQKYPNCTFIVNTIACHGGGLATAMESFQDEAAGATPGRVTVITQSNHSNVNFAADYTTRYNAALAYYLMQGLEAGTGDRLTYGQAHIAADKKARENGFTNASGYRSMPNGNSKRTASTQDDGNGKNLA